MNVTSRITPNSSSDMAEAEPTSKFRNAVE
jgi:hypothetical protein